MKNYTGLFSAMLISLTLTWAGIPDAEAKRFGGGGSFGGRSSYSSPFRRSATSIPKRSASQQKAHQKNQSARQNMSRRGGLMGMLGGLALGGLLGSLLFGGAFEGINFMDILLFGGIAYLLFKLLAARSRPRQQPAYSHSNDVTYQDSYADERQSQNLSYSEPAQRSSANFDTDILFKKDGRENYSENTQIQNDLDFDKSNTPSNFDEADFLAGAKGAFEDLQKAWDSQGLAEIRGLTTDKVFAEIQQQLKDSAEINQTDVLKIDAELLSIREVGPDFEAVVLFDCIIREGENNQAEQVREVWHFIKSVNSVHPKWYLDGIQQLEQ